MIVMVVGGIGVIFFILVGIVVIIKCDFSNMGKFLIVGLVLLIVVLLVNFFFYILVVLLVILGVVVLLFLGFILFDINCIVYGGEISYVLVMLVVYFDIYNFFISLL